MRTFLKTLIGGAVGIGALYVVGKVCYEIGKDVAEVERQLATGENEVAHTEASGGTGEETPRTEEQPTQAEPVGEPKQTVVGRTMDKIRNAKMFLKVKKALTRDGKSPGVLGSLLSNPEGAKIEAFVMDGGVRINVRPRAA